MGEACSHYELVSGSGPYALASAETAYVTVRFKPTADGQHECDVETGAAECSDVYCEGTGNSLIGIHSAVPGKLTLYQNYPNPFNPTTTIEYSIERRSHVTLKVYDVTGALVTTLVDREVDPSQVQPVTWDGRDGAGTRVASGVYFYHLVAGDFAKTRKMVLLK